MGSRIPCDEETFEAARDIKEDMGVTWDALIRKRVVESGPYAEVSVDSESLLDSLREDLDELLTINVQVDLSDESDLDESDVKRIVKDKIESTVHEKARQL